jgi:hypothetical protein
MCPISQPLTQPLTIPLFKTAFRTASCLIQFDPIVQNSHHARLLTKVGQIDAQLRAINKIYEGFKKNPLLLTENKIYEHQKTKKIKKILPIVSHNVESDLSPNLSFNLFPGLSQILLPNHIGHLSPYYPKDPA